MDLLDIHEYEHVFIHNYAWIWIFSSFTDVGIHSYGKYYTLMIVKETEFDHQQPPKIAVSSEVDTMFTKLKHKCLFVGTTTLCWQTAYCKICHVYRIQSLYMCHVSIKPSNVWPFIAGCLCRRTTHTRRKKKKIKIK